MVSGVTYGETLRDESLMSIHIAIHNTPTPVDYCTTAHPIVEFLRNIVVRRVAKPGPTSRPFLKSPNTVASTKTFTVYSTSSAYPTQVRYFPISCTWNR